MPTERNLDGKIIKFALIGVSDDSKSYKMYGHVTKKNNYEGKSGIWRIEVMQLEKNYQERSKFFVPQMVQR